MSISRVTFRALLIAALSVAVVGPAVVHAGHPMVGASIVVRRVNDVDVAYYKAYADCDSTSCVVQVPMSKRDLNRMLRWCGDTYVTLVKENVLSSKANLAVCQGSSTWHMRILADTYSAPDNFYTHDNPVTITVQGVAAPGA